jgi:ribosomal protein S12 methylthiotransferase
MRKYKAGIISLGCSKNLVDSELILGCLKDADFEITANGKDADVVIVNTCGFIASAKEESINTILEAARDKKEDAKLVVTGCLSQRYPDELKESLPEVDLFWGVGRHKELVDAIRAMFGVKCGCAYSGKRMLSTPKYSAYLRIADGCDNRCTYCAIPLIRGGRRSVPMENLIAEAEALAAGGVKELTLIAQDTSAYGSDIYGEPRLAELLTELSKIDGIKWLRVLYAYPNTVTEKLVDTMLNNEKIVRYIDMPIQHIDPIMLETMNRHGSAEHIRAITRYIRESSPDFILRTTVMLGFPGETEEQFNLLYDFLKKEPFDRIGAFVFCPEDGTKAALMDGQIDESVANARLDKIMRMQQAVSLELNKNRIGKEYDVLVEHINNGIARGRSYAEAPDVDGIIKILNVPNTVNPGDFVRVKITDASAYDLKGEYIK